AADSSTTAGTVAVIPADEAAPLLKRFRSSLGEHLLVVPHSRIFDLSGDLAAAERECEGTGRHASDLLEALAATLALPSEGEVPLDHVVQPPPQSISLNVSSSCNLSCSYCYAARGSFGGAQPDAMTWEVARAAIDGLLDAADPQAPVTVGFLGGEPFVNRRLVHRAVEYAAAEGKRRGLSVGFSVTTNGTLLSAEDIELLRLHRFAVTVSVDGGAELQNRQRPLPVHAGGSYARLREATAPLLAAPGRAKIAARATVTRSDFNLRERFEAILSMGFPEVGFAPLRAAPHDAGALRDEDWPGYLDAVIRAAEPELERACEGGTVRLTNFAVALKQIHRGASSPYPCGAGGGYFSVSARGAWYACHRAVGSEPYRLGDSTGIEPARQREFLVARHVHAQAACRQCWARYLCSGGCHQEASHRNDSACGFIRGWLEFCLAAYCELGERNPDFFNPEQGAPREEYT
ncbi:MAG TPA: radical SAM protein, partial [Pyrinomonadaceae bacterium]